MELACQIFIPFGEPLCSCSFHLNDFVVVSETDNSPKIRIKKHNNQTPRSLSVKVWIKNIIYNTISLFNVKTGHR